MSPSVSLKRISGAVERRSQILLTTLEETFLFPERIWETVEASMSRSLAKARKEKRGFLRDRSVNSFCNHRRKFKFCEADFSSMSGILLLRGINFHLKSH